MATNYLFYSLQCQHSRQLLGKLKGHPICQGINFVNIDDPRVNIPAFIQAVPTLYISSMKRVLCDQELTGWVDNMTGGSRAPNGSSLAPNQQPQMGGTMGGNSGGVINMGSITGDDNISPFMSGEMLGGSSMASYSFIDDGLNEKMGHNFAFLDDRDISSIPSITKMDGTPSSSGMGGSGQGGRGGSKTGRSDGLSSDYEKMMAARANDIPKPMSAMRM